MVNSNFDYLQKLELINFELEFQTKQLNPQINFLIQNYFFQDNPTWNINYSEYPLMVKIGR